MGVKMPRSFDLGDILDADQIRLVRRLYKRSPKKFYLNCMTQIVSPNWNRIMAVLGPCDARQVVYGIEYRCLKPGSAAANEHRPTNTRRRKMRTRRRGAWTENPDPESAQSLHC